MKSLNLSDFRAMLPVHKHKLDDELEVQADMQDRISQRVTMCATAEAFAKDELARLEASLTMDFRESMQKATVGEIAGAVLRDRKRIQAFKDHQAAVAEHADWKNLLESWRQKGFSLSKLGDLYIGNYFSPTSAGTRQAVRDAEQGGARRAMREAADAVRSVAGRHERAAFLAQQSAVEAGVAPRQTEPPAKGRRRVVE